MPTLKYIILLICLIHGSSIVNAQTFADVAASLGVDMKHEMGDIEDGEWGTGAAFFDSDLDGDLDLYVSNRAEDNVFYRNNGNGTFTDITALTGLECAGPFFSMDCAGISVADFNNDSLPDIYVGSAKEDFLFKNLGNNVYQDVSNSSNIRNITEENRTMTISWIDFDLDSYLDIYVAVHSPSEYVGWQNAGLQDFLMRNNGDGTFSDVTHSVFTQSQALLAGGGFVSSWSDVDQDEDFDLVTTYDCPHHSQLPNQIWENNGGTSWEDWEFNESGEDYNFDDCANSMGLAIGDYNQDGKMDLAYTNIGQFKLWKNNGSSFTETTSSAGLEVIDTSHFSWGINMADFDNDSYQDLIVVAGYLEIPQVGVTDTTQENYYYRNEGDGTFEDKSASSGFQSTSRARTSIYGDYDNDGDLDIYIVNYNSKAELFKNNLANGNNWITIDLQGTVSNYDGIGSFIRLKREDGTYLYYETRSGSSLGGGDSPRAHFGLGGDENIPEVRIIWPSGIIQFEDNLAVNDIITIVEDEELLPSKRIELEGELLNDGSRKLLWSSGALPSVIERKLDNGAFQVIAHTIPSYTGQSSYVDTERLGKKLYYRVRSGNQISNVIHILSQDYSDVLVSPNLISVETEVYVSSSSMNIERIFLHDALGRVIRSQEFPAIGVIRVFNLPDLNAGTYFLKIESSEHSELRKIQVVR